MLEHIWFIRRFIEIKKEQWLDPSELHRCQMARLGWVLRSAGDTEHYAGFGADGLRNIPLTRKEDVRASPEDFIRRGIDRANLTRFHTSGSSGMPLTLYMDRECAYLRSAQALAMLTELGLKPSDKYVSLTARIHSADGLLTRLGILRRSSLNIFDREEVNLESLIRLKADFVQSLPSFGMILASMNEEQGNPLSFRTFLSAGEYLSPATRAFIERSFGCRVYNAYGTSEFGTIAFECPEERNMHVNSSSVVVEIVDKQDRPQKSGVGDVVVTGLNNRAMPLLRYKIGDRASWGERCACGRSLPVLESFDGREEPPIVLPSGRIRSASSLDQFSGISGIKCYQLIQERPGRFVFRYVPYRDGPGPEGRAEVLRIISRGCLGEDVSVDFDERDSIEKGKSGKMRSVVSKAGLRWHL